MTPRTQRFAAHPLLLASLLTATFGLLFGACGDAPATGDVGTGLIVENPFHGPHQTDGAYRLVMEELVQFGAEEAPERELLSQIRGVEVDSDGNVYILDGNRLISFTAEGEFRWESGREGEGPGEFSRARSMFMTPDGLLLVANQGERRLDLFSLSGKFVLTIPRDVRGMQGFLSPTGFLNDSTVVFTGAAMPTGTVVRLLRSPDWVVTDSFQVIPTLEDPPPGGLLIGGSGAVIDGQIVLRRSDMYELSIHAPDGDTLRVVRRNVPDFTRHGFAVSGNNLLGVSFYSRISMPVALPGGYHLVSARWPTNIPDPDEHATASFSGENPPDPINHTTLDVYDADWRLLFSIENEELDALDFGTVRAQPAPGDLYIVRTSPYPHVARVRVTVEKSE